MDFSHGMKIDVAAERFAVDRHGLIAAAVLGRVGGDLRVVVLAWLRIALRQKC